MTKLKEHIIFNVITLLLAVLLLVPSAIKLAHIFSHHEHDICQGVKTTHLHEINADCDIYKFQANTSFYIWSQYVALIKRTTHLEPIKISFNYLKNHWQLSFSLRGPPHLV